MGWELIEEIQKGLELNHVVIVNIQSWIKYIFSNTLLRWKVIWESLLQVHDEAPKFVEEFAMQGFGEEIAKEQIFGDEVVE